MTTLRSKKKAGGPRLLYIPEDKNKEYNDFIWEVCKQLERPVKPAFIFRGILDVVLNDPELKARVIDEISGGEKQFN